MATSQMNRVIEYLHRAVLLTDGAGLSDGQLLERFIAQRDDAAFEALVRRHGPMVLGVCRRVLRNHHDAEDAFQATFLVLVRKATSIVPREMVGNWLYGVAYQTALKARATAARRRARERQVKEMPEPQVLEHDLWPDLQSLLDQELSRLPDKYRIPIVLCDLEGKTYKEAARQLGCPEGTLSARLARARTMLAKRLARHGFAVSGAALAALLPQGAASASVPAALVVSTVKAATLFAAGQAAATGVVSTTVAALTEGVLKTMLLTKIKIATAVLLLVATVAVGLRGLMYETQASPPANTRNEPGVKAEDQSKTAVVKDLEKLQGTWIAISAERQGEQTPEEKVKEAKIRLVISGDSFTLKTARNKEGLKGTLKIDPTQQPKTMTMDWLANRPEDEKGLNAKGIYVLEGDTLKFCFGKERPTEFKTKPDRDLDVRLYVFKREKPAPAKEKTKVLTNSKNGVIGRIDETSMDLVKISGTLGIIGLPIAKEVKVTLGGKKARLADLRPEMPVKVTRTWREDEQRKVIEGQVVTAIEAEHLEFDYWVQGVNADKRTVSLTVAGAKAPVFDLPVKEGAKISRGSKLMKLTELRPEMRLSVSMSEDGRVIQAIRVRKDFAP